MRSVHLVRCRRVDLLDAKGIYGETPLIYAIQRDPRLWDRPTEFDPDRFRPEVAKQIDRWQYLPFGAGPRTCVGDHFAMLELALALGTIVRHNEIRSLEPEFPMATPFTLVAAARITC